MATINLGNANAAEGHVKHMDLKQPAIHIHPVMLDTPSLTPATTPDQNSPSEDDAMAGKKVFSLQRPDDKARDLAAKLTLEEQVRTIQLRTSEHGPIRALDRWSDHIKRCNHVVFRHFVGSNLPENSF